MKWLKINPLVLIIINLMAPTLYIFVKASYLQVFLVVFCASVMAAMGCFKRLFICSGIYAAMFGIYYLGINYNIVPVLAGFMAIMLQFVPCLMLASVIISKYNSAQLLSALESAHIPRVLVVATTITIKYIPTFRREFGYIMESMRLRGIAVSWKRPLSSFRYIIAPQLFRCAAIAEEVTAAGLVKGIDAPMRRSSYYEQKIRFSDILILFIFVCGIVGGLVWAK